MGKMKAAAMLRVCDFFEFARKPALKRFKGPKEARKLKKLQPLRSGFPIGIRFHGSGSHLLPSRLCLGA